MKIKTHIKKDEVKFVILLISISFVLYIIHYLIFRDPHHLALFALEDLAFVPIDVIFVYLILHRVLDSTEKEKKLSKLYMIIEMFYSVIGTELLREFASHDNSLSKIQDDLIIKPEWTENEFNQFLNVKRNYKPNMTYECSNIIRIKEMLEESRPHLLRILGNQALLEHETFTEVLMAVFHLGEELRHREDLINLSDEDKEHIITDAKRAYILLGIEWVDYINHMRIHYPYLYSLSIRVNPFDTRRDVSLNNNCE